MVSFVARQRDLRELVGDNLAGALQLQFADVLKYWEARFHKITLEDRNLPVIAKKRILKPRNDVARNTLEAAFSEVQRERADVLSTLLTTTADREMFRQVYPFTPALIQTLIAVSSVLQRERTALKLMLQLLVDRRDELFAHLAAKRIHGRRFWHPLHTQKPYAEPGSRFPVSASQIPRAMWLPSAFTLSDADVMTVCKEIREFLS